MQPFPLWHANLRSADGRLWAESHNDQTKNDKRVRSFTGKLASVTARQISIGDVSGEPFRVFFPLAVIAGMLGVAIWPLHFAGLYPSYPGVPHVRLMTEGFFGGFIFGFLGTALPRVLSARRLSGVELIVFSVLYLSLVGLHVTGQTIAGDIGFLLLLGTFVGRMATRFRSRSDMPPPGFVLILLAFACAATGAVLSVLSSRYELSIFWINLQRLLLSQGFILLPVLGVGAFLLPRFFGLISQHNFQESISPPAGWIRLALLAAVTGILIISTFVIESMGWHRLAHSSRFLLAGAYLFQMAPIFQSPKTKSTLGTVLKGAMIMILAGFLATAIFPVYRVGLLHVTLVGGLGILTFAVATRVVFGHSGQMAKLQAPNRWLAVAVLLMLLGMATRISGDYWPNVLASHYSYGAVIWIAGALFWASRVLPKVRFSDE